MVPVRGRAEVAAGRRGRDGDTLRFDGSFERSAINDASSPAIAGVLRQVQALCKQAEVPVVRAHRLRGLHATLATEAGATPHLVATALGHTSTAVAERHYTDRGAAHGAKTRKVVDRLAKPAGRSHPVAQATAAVGNG